MDIREFDSLNFSYTVFNCEFKLQSEQINGKEVNFINATFKQKVTFCQKIIDCIIYFEEACFESDLILTRAHFNNEVNLDKAIIKGEAQFCGTQFNRAILTETNFENKADFSNAVFNNKADFTNAVFEADTDFSSATFTDEARFLNAGFKGTAIFENAEFKGKADFKTDKNLTFGKDVNFSNTNFQDNAYFNNRVFEEFVNFHEADFKKVACFYSVTFKKPVNFSSIIFNGALNFVNAKTDFTYKELKELIETQIKRDKSIDNIKRTNDFRDGFRLMKYNLNNKGNALDASLFHRLELYCKELELEFTLDKDGGNSKEVKPADETKGSPKDKNRIEILLDLITLKLYRNISDHHTNLLRIINFMVLTIAAYGLCFYIFDIFLLETIVANPKALVFSIILCYIVGLIVYMNLGIKQSAVVVIATLICVFYGIGKYYPIFTINFILLYLSLYFVFFYLHKFRLAKILTYLICIFIFLSKPTLITPFIGVFTSEQAVESKFKEYAARYNENGLDDMLLDANLTSTKKDNKLDFIVENRKTILEELECEKTLLINSKNKCAQNTNETVYSNLNNKIKKPYAKALAALKYDEIMQSTQKSANLLYGFIMLLVIYSLTKTARKNSVVPS
nr:pentapeptide repeat-containing protein [uncultured Campylobacter sp.]